MMAGKRNWGDSWLHIDGADYPHIASNDIYLKALPANWVDLVYCSHGVGYFSTDEISYLLKCWFKVLKPGGVLRIATPDWDAIKSLDVPLGRVIGPLYGMMKMDGDIIYHKTIYTYGSLAATLMVAGFAEPKRYDHQLTEHPNTGDRNDYFDDHAAAYIDGHLISLNVECIKP